MGLDHPLFMLLVVPGGIFHIHFQGLVDRPDQDLDGRPVDVHHGSGASPDFFRPRFHLFSLVRGQDSADFLEGRDSIRVKGVDVLLQHRGQGLAQGRHFVGGEPFRQQAVRLVVGATPVDPSLPGGHKFNRVSAKISKVIDIATDRSGNKGIS